MKLLNYKIKSLTALFLVGLSSSVLASPCEETFSSKVVPQKTDQVRHADSNKKEQSNSVSEDKSISRLEQAVRDAESMLSRRDSTQNVSEKLQIIQDLMKAIFEDRLSQIDLKQISPEERQRAHDLMKAIEDAKGGLGKAIDLFVTINESKAKTGESRQLKDHLIKMFIAFMDQALFDSIGHTSYGRLKQAVRDLDVKYILSKDYKEIPYEDIYKARSLIKAIHEIYGKTKESELIESHLAHLYNKYSRSDHRTLIFFGIFIFFGGPLVVFPGLEVIQHYSGGIEDPHLLSEWYINTIDQIIELFKGEQIVDAELIQGNEQIEE